MNETPFIERLRTALPDWHFENFKDTTSHVAAFPPDGKTSLDNWNKLMRHNVVILRVNGVFYTITKRML